MTESKPKPKRGRPPDTEKREQIRKLLAAGRSQAEIVKELGINEGTLRYHIRKLGIAPRRLRFVFKGHKIVGDVKRCAICDEEKALTEFRHPNHSACAACRREQGFDDS